MTILEQAVAFAIEQAKYRGHAEVGPDELLLGGLRAIAQFGVVQLGPWTLDLEDLGLDWLSHPEKQVTKVAYSLDGVALLDKAARIARAESAPAMQLDHLLAAFASEDTGIMGRLKQEHGITSAGWRAALALRMHTATTAMLPDDPASGHAPVQTSAQRDYLTPEEAAEALGIHVQTLRGYVRSGKLPALRLAGERSLRIRRTDLEAVLEPLIPQTIPNP